jgi:hypothetical protein
MRESAEKKEGLEVKEGRKQMIRTRSEEQEL